MGSKRVWSVLAIISVLGVSCGDRDQKVASRSSKSSDTSGASPSAESSPADSGLPADYPCSKGDAKGATEKGVTDTTIKIATIQDVDNPAQPGLMLPNLQAMQGFVKMCNGLGGINGRKLELENYDAGLVKYKEAIAKACEADVLALVGTAAVLDGDASQDAVACGIVDVPGLTAEPGHGTAANMVQAMPHAGDAVNIAVEKYLFKQDPKRKENIGGLFSNRPVTNLVGRQHADAMVRSGATRGSVQLMNDIGQTNWGPFIDALKGSGLIYAVGAPDATGSFLDAAHNSGVKLPPVVGDQSLYNQAWLDAHKDSAEGVVWVPVTTCFLEEADSCPELLRYAAALKDAGISAPPSALGIQTWSSALLFADAVKKLGSDVTRPKLLAQLKSVTKWTGFGINGETNPSANTIQACVAIARVEGGKYVRVTPKSGYSCDPSNVVMSDVAEG